MVDVVNLDSDVALALWLCLCLRNLQLFFKDVCLVCIECLSCNWASDRIVSLTVCCCWVQSSGTYILLVGCLRNKSYLILFTCNDFVAHNLLASFALEPSLDFVQNRITLFPLFISLQSLSPWLYA